ncbi:MAG: hypothetical protein Q8M83_01310 [bacterium]|nr:hypothetical protein [bacterium]
MARMKSTKQNIRKLTRLGKKSLGLTLPTEYVKKLNWRERQKVVVRLKGRTLLVRDWRK